ncbi:LOW QUALITY PROTEIN: uncharacterized protein LOC121188452 [Toxotes jaculatrix]|uniref:LOW QUALITY PROTEIN: uncharacterized protein LOC121188452 n=1 Tax=Toxotes jaculatrix TaxID=941984 RepID=UPI001B3B0BDA|nr:LOW QUALITY PROTEIN: uncharacterized protein LOC121188452 [Toxotes jaculatrix]
MFKMHLGIALASVVVAVFPLLLDCITTCQMGNQNDYAEGQCPVKLSQKPQGTDLWCVTVHVWMKANDFSKTSKITISSPSGNIRNNMTKKEKKCKSKHQFRCNRGIRQQPHNISFDLWEFVYDCVEAEAESIISVSYSTPSNRCSVSCTVQDPVPNFDLSVDRSSKSINVTVGPEDKVYTRWCYRKNAVECIAGSSLSPILIDPSQSRSAVLNIPYLLPCVCVQVYYTHVDARRDKKCPFEKEMLTDVQDVWRSSNPLLYESSLKWSSVCPASDLKISASLCWRQHEHLCTPILNSTLEEMEDVPNLIYNISTVDKHPNMCVQFSLQGQHNISCPFQADISSWKVYIGLGKQSVIVNIASSVPAVFSAQLCVVNEMGCSPLGLVHTLIVSGNVTETRIKVPPHFLAEKPCVQVWQSDPALHGKRILCPDYTHKRCGIYVVAALVLVGVIALLGIFIHRLTKSGAAGWLYISKPVLLVCSSEQSAHVSAVCALASVLQGELSATVHMALWAQSSQKQTGARTGVADLGPLPWLYGQWETVRKAQGKVLIIWSPEAKTTYEKWKEEKMNEDKPDRKKEGDGKADLRHEKTRVDVEEDYKLSERSLGKCKKEKAGGRIECVKLCDDKDWCPQKESSSVIEPVFAAALACLQGTLQQCKGQGVAIVYFQGLGHSRDIPKALRDIPRYCLPQDFRGLIQELGGMTKGTKTDKFRCHCWPRLLSKVQSIWLAQQLAHRLQTLLPQMQGKKMPGPSITSSRKKTSDKTESRLKLPLAANMARPETVQEQEPLYRSPWRAERL